MVRMTGPSRHTDVTFRHTGAGRYLSQVPEILTFVRMTGPSRHTGVTFRHTGAGRYLSRVHEILTFVH